LKSSKVISQQLINNPQSKTLLATVLKSSSKLVRELSSDFAIQIGRSQPVVFKWLLNELDDIDHTDETCSDIFRALGVLLDELNKIPGAINLSELSELLSTRLMGYPRESQPSSEERQALLGYLNLLEKLINIDVKVVTSTALGDKLEEILMSEFLFTIPSNEQDRRPICDTPIVKKAAYSVLSSLLSKSENSFEYVLNKLSLLSDQTGNEMKRRNAWGLQVSHDMKKDNIVYTGLKNQGCTCYMNSLLQNLFMSTDFRETILNTNLKDSHRTSLWHKSPEEVIGVEILVEWSNGEWRKAKILSYEADIQEHTLGYYELNGNCIEMISINIHEGRYNKETGRVKMYPREVDEPLTEAEDAAHGVLEQLQRTFCFMKHSKKRYFDPRPFVDACKTLKMNYSVYQQNDACEFFDQLLDRIELATKGKHTKQQVWNQTMINNVFGGKLQYQKIPTDCVRYKEDKRSCGHWQSTRTENFLKIELPLRGKEKISDSFENICEGELLDGDNKVDCDVCVNKMATIRRTCLGNLPNLMVLTIKRFDLDFQTFETVKINSRFAFETHLNMLPYSKEGMELEEHKEYLRQQENISLENTGLRERNISISYDKDDYVEPDVADFEYELQGILVHAGVAQGGHYYSFVRDDDIDEEKSWYKFDDEDVTEFNPGNIPAQCYGGPPSANDTNGTNGSHAHLADEDRTSNALMLFYKKVRPNENIDDKSEEGAVDVVTTSLTQTSISAADNDVITISSNSVGSDLINGYQGFIREVQESNLQHILYCYLLDSDMHIFVRGLIRSVTMAAKNSITKEIKSSNSYSNLNIIDEMNQFDTELSYHFNWSPNESNPDIAKKLVQFGVTFLLDVILHCRERCAMKQWVEVIKEAFITFPDTASFFIFELIKNNQNTWLNEYLLYCSDQSARQTFVQLVFAAVQVIAPKTDEGLVKNLKLTQEELRKKLSIIDSSSTIHNNTLLSCLYLELMDKLWRVPQHVKNSDEIFVLIRDLASIPSFNSTMIQMNMISYLSFFIMPNNVNGRIRSNFMMKQNKNNRHDYFPMLYQSIYEAIASLLGVPQVRKVPLYIERSHYIDNELVEDAQRALTTIFSEISHNGGLSIEDIINYKEQTTQTRVTAQTAKLTIDKYSHNNDGRMNLNGFLEYYTEQSLYYQQEVWRDLHAFGFRNDLTRMGTENLSDHIDPLVESKLVIPAPCKACLESFYFYSSGLDVSSASSLAIVKRVCFEDETSSKHIINQTIIRLYSLCCEWSFSNQMIGIIIDFLFLLLSIEDSCIQSRMNDLFTSNQNASLIRIAIKENQQITNCQANERDKHTLLRRYIEIIQKFCVLPKFVTFITSLSEQHPQVAKIKRMLKLKPDSDMTDEEELMIKSSTIYVDGAGAPDVNGEYLYFELDLKHHCGLYRKRIELHDGTFDSYWIYKYKNSKINYWFISSTPGEGKPGIFLIFYFNILIFQILIFYNYLIFYILLGTNSDLDFYIADYGRKNDQFSHMPPVKDWRSIDGKSHSMSPVPTIRWKADGYPMMGGDGADYSGRVGNVSSDSDDEMNDNYSNASSSPERGYYH
jgi:ubiquitin C-terminal hydrolase